MPDYYEPALQDSSLMGAYSETWDSDAVEDVERGLRPGDLVKLCLTIDQADQAGAPSGERMWFEVVEAVNGGYVATCANVPVFPHLHGVSFGTRVRFEPRHALRVDRSRSV